MDIETVFKRFEPDLKIVEDELQKVFASKAVAIPSIGKHVIINGGKRLRPLYLLLCSALSGYNENQRFTLAGVIEAIHTASLLHDDVIDGAEIRRGKEASHLLWGNQVVILTGDFIYATALLIAAELKIPRVLESITYGITKMTEGELLQLSKIADPQITEEDYITIVSLKTGSLFSAACRIGGILGNLSDDKVEALTKFGLDIGTAYQMADDLLDYEADEDELGKSLGKDLKEGKVTLPLIYLLKNASEVEKKEISQIISNGKERQTDNNDDLKRILNMLRKYEINEKSVTKAISVTNSAKNHLSLFEDSPHKAALTIMADYALQRNK